MESSFWRVVAALVMISPLNGQLQQVCNEGNYDFTGIVLPVLPDQYSVRIEANFLNQNQTTIFHEVYDQINNRGSLSIRTNNSFHRSIYDYENNEIFIFPDVRSDRECTVYTLSESSFINFTFGVIVNDDGSVHIGTPGRFIENLRDETPTRYAGLDTIRGIPVQHWQSCFNFENVSYTADYYYTTTYWNYAVIGDPTFYEMIPVQIEIQGQSTLRNTPLHDFRHIYSIIDYQSGPDSVSDRDFTVPSGLACAGRIPGMPRPEVPRFFTTYVQYIDFTSSRKTVGTAREYYDMEHNLFRIDSYYDGRFGGEAGPVSLIHDFNSQVQFIINRHTSNCTSSPVGKDFLYFDEELDSEGLPQLVSPNGFFLLGNEFNYSYEGVSTVRGVEVDSWVSIRDFEVVNSYSNLTNGVYEIFFTRPEYNITTDRSAGTSIIPWRMTLRGQLTYSNFTSNETVTMDVNFLVDLFDFSTTEPPYDSFDASVCFTDDQLHTLILIFNVPIVGVDFRIFRTNLRTSLINLTKMKPLQISNIQLLNSNSTHFISSLHLVNISEHATVGEEERRVTADEALRVIRDNLRATDQTIPLGVEVSSGVFIDPVLFNFSRGRNVTCNIPSVDNSTTTKMNCSKDNFTNRLGLTDAIVSGVAVGLFFAGLLVGLLLIFTCWCCIKCMRGKGSMNVSSGASSVKYKKHDDEMDAFS